MSLFDRFRKSGPEQVCVEIAGIISGGDPEVAAEAAACAAAPEEFFRAHSEQYDWYYMQKHVEANMLRWDGLIFLLEAHNHVCIRDWKDEKEDFLFFLQNLSGAGRLGLEIDGEWLDEAGCISQWCQVIDRKWDRACVAAMDQHSDSYVLFPCRVEDLEKLRVLADQLGERIALAREM